MLKSLSAIMFSRHHNTLLEAHVHVHIVLTLIRNLFLAAIGLSVEWTFMMMLMHCDICCWALYCVDACEYMKPILPQLLLLQIFAFGIIQARNSSFDPKACKVRHSSLLSHFAVLDPIPVYQTWMNDLCCPFLEAPHFRNAWCGAHAYGSLRMNDMHVYWGQKNLIAVWYSKFLLNFYYGPLCFCFTSSTQSESL